VLRLAGGPPGIFLGRLAIGMEDYLFFSPLHCIQGKKGAEWSFSLNAGPGANDQHEMVVEVFFLRHGAPFGLGCAVSVLAPFFQ
jgi:hypothetical protein